MLSAGHTHTTKAHTYPQCTTQRAITQLYLLLSVLAQRRIPSRSNQITSWKWTLMNQDRSALWQSRLKWNRHARGEKEMKRFSKPLLVTAICRNKEAHVWVKIWVYLSLITMLCLNGGNWQGVCVCVCVLCVCGVCGVCVCVWCVCVCVCVWVCVVCVCVWVCVVWCVWCVVCACVRKKKCMVYVFLKCV